MDVVNALKEWLNDQPDIMRAILFGTYATGKVTKLRVTEVVTQSVGRNVNSAEGFMPSIEQMLMGRREGWLMNG